MSTLTAYPSFGAVSTKRSQGDNGANAIEAKGLPSLTVSELARHDEIDTILVLPQQYQNANWNGEGAAPIPEAAIEEARIFLQKLPTTFPLPEVTPEPDGYLGLEWYANKSLLYVVSFDGKGALSCSGLIGPDRTYGRRYMDDGIPAEILRNIAKITP